MFKKSAISKNNDLANTSQMKDFKELPERDLPSNSKTSSAGESHDAVMCALLEGTRGKESNMTQLNSEKNTDDGSNAQE